MTRLSSDSTLAPASSMTRAAAVRTDHEYEHGGTANVFLAFEPLAGARYT